MFRQDLAAPYGTDGTIARLDNFGNLVYTTLFDQTMLTTPTGRAFVHKVAPGAGDAMIDSYVKVLAATGVRGYPYAVASRQGMPGEEDNPVGFRVDNAKLLAMNAYLTSLQAPKGASVGREVAMHGREAFRTAGCNRRE